jgi:hypothetical protein
MVATGVAYRGSVADAIADCREELLEICKEVTL